MKRFLGLTLAATTALSVAAYAAPQPDRVRGTIESVDQDTMTVKSRQGGDVKVTLDNATKYASVVKSSLSDVTKGSYIGTATKGSGDLMVALEVVIFPASMRGAGEGHYGWDELPDTTLSGNSTAPSSMTNGNVQSASPAGSAMETKSAMTNGNVQSSSEKSGAKQITVTYKGGEQKILVPPTTPIVAFQPGDHSILKQGAHVFVSAVSDNGTVTAKFVGVGKDGVVPPM